MTSIGTSPFPGLPNSALVADLQQIRDKQGAIPDNPIPKFPITVDPATGQLTPASTNALGASGVPVTGMARNSLRWLSALAKVRAGTGHAKVCIVSDSTSGVGAGAGTGAGNLVGARTKNLASCLSSQFNQAGIPARDDTLLGEQFTYFSPLGGGHYGQYDTRTVLTGTATNVPDGLSYAFGGILLTPGAAGTIALTPRSACDSVVAYYLNSYAGSADLIVGASTLATVTAAATNTMAKTAALTYAKGTATINVTGTAGALALAGLWAYDSTTPAVHFFAAGMYGAKIDVMNSTARYYHPGNAAPWTLFAFDLVLIDMTINSMVVGASELQNWITQTQAVITSAKASGASVALVTPNPVGLAAVPASVSAVFVGAAYALATSNSIALIDYHSRVNGDQAALAALGMYVDDRHMSNYQDKATCYTNTLALVK